MHLWPHSGPVRVYHVKSILFFSIFKKEKTRYIWRWLVKVQNLWFYSINRGIPEFYLFNWRNYYSKNDSILACGGEENKARKVNSYFLQKVYHVLYIFFKIDFRQISFRILNNFLKSMNNAIFSDKASGLLHISINLLNPVKRHHN